MRCDLCKQNERYKRFTGGGDNGADIDMCYQCIEIVKLANTIPLPGVRINLN